MYSPASKIKRQCSAMERRIKDMKEKRENISPTGMKMNVIYEKAEINSLFVASFSGEAGIVF